MELTAILFIALIIVFCSILLLLVKRKRKKGIEGDEGLESYIRKAIKKGHLEANIKMVLQEQGWPQKLVDITFEKIKKEPEKKLLNLIHTGKIEREEEKLTKQVSEILHEQQILKLRIDAMFAKYYELKKREEEFLSAKGDLIKQKRMPQKINEEEIKRLIAMLDTLLEKLPEEEINKFSKSTEFKTYQQILQQEKEKGKENNDQLQEIQRVLSSAREGKLTQEQARKMLGLSEIKVRESRANKLKEEKMIEKLDVRGEKKQRFLNKIKKALQKKPSLKSQHKGKQKLVHVVKEALKKGYSKKQIELGLKKRGWPSKEIQNSFL